MIPHIFADLQIIIFLLLPLCCTAMLGHEFYDYTLDIGNPLVLCPGPNATCSNGQPHYLCKSEDLVAERCKCYRAMGLSNKLKKIFVDGHNGIRHKVAQEFHIANMNLVYWSRELAAMADAFLRECLIEPDTCEFIGERQLPVNANYIFRNQHPVGRWPGRVVRSWYLELGHKVHSFAEFIVARRNGKMENFTQMIWPPLEFIGCGGARMFKGYFIVCYYHPPYNETRFVQHYVAGKPCTYCAIFRPTCSQQFPGLCGIDVVMEGAAMIRLNLYLFCITCFYYLMY